MRKKLLLTTMFLLACFGIAKAETIQIGSGSATDYGMPLYNNWKYGLTQQIYTSEEIVKTGTITSIAFKAVEDMGLARTIDIYLVKTNKSTFDDAQDYISASESDKVFSGTVTFAVGAWTTIEFDKHFDYNGSTNLCLIVNDKTGAYTTPLKNWLVYSSQNQAIFRASDNYEYNPASPKSLPSGAAPVLKSFKSQIKLTFADGGGGGGSGTGETIQVGSGEKTNWPSPTNTCWENTYSQQIYLASEIAKTGTITSLAFCAQSCDDATVTSQSRTLDIYMLKTSKSSFSSNTDWLSVSESDKVFSGTVTFPIGDWTTITLSKPFEYDGTANLCIVVNDKSGSDNEKPINWLSYWRSNNELLYIISPSSIDPLSPPTGDMFKCKAQLQLTFSGGGGGGSESGDVVQVGSGTETTEKGIPLTTRWNYGLTEQIYTAAEIGKAGTITSLAFNMAEASGVRTRNIDLYLVKTNQTSFGTISDGIAATESDKVFSGTVTFAVGDWTTITFSKPFEYDGTANLCVVVNDKTGENSQSSPRWLVYYGTNQTLRVYNDNYSEFNPASPDGWSANSGLRGIVQEKSQLQLTFSGGGGGGSESGVVEVTGTASEIYVPTNVYFKYSLTQQIYTSEEIGSAQNITNIGFYNNGGERTRNVDLYLVHTSKSDFATDTDWVSFSESDKVFSGEVTFTEGSWTTINFNKSFAYNGSDNLVVIMDDNTGVYKSSAPFLVFGTSKYQTLYECTDSEDLVAENLSTYKGDHVTYKNQIKVNGKLITGPLPGNNGLPTISLYNYALTQQIYTKQELGKAQDFTSVSFFNEGQEKTRDLDIYMVHTNKSDYVITNSQDNTSNDWVSFTEADKVFSGNVTFINNDWTVIRFSKAFSYDGTSNVVLIVDDNTGSYSSGLKCLAFDAPYMVLYESSDETNFSIDGLSSYDGSMLHKKNAIRLNEAGLDIVPTGIAITNITWQSALVTWESEGSMWNLQYKKSSASEWIEISGLTTRSYELESLSGDTSYDVRVQVVDGSGTPGGWVSTSFTTPEQYPRPSDLNVSHITPNTAIVEWTDNCGASAWVLYLYDYSTNEGESIETTKCPHALINLKEGTSYCVYVRSIIDEDAEIYSNWYGSVDFTTSEFNPAPYDIAVEPASTSATISWKGTSESYEVMYRKESEGTLYDFDDSTLQGWTTIDADGDGYTWVLGSAIGGVYLLEEASIVGEGYNGSTDLMASGSYSNMSGVGALNPDNYLVSPLVELGGSISFYVCGQDGRYPHEHFGVAVSTTSNTDPAAFTLLDEWTLNADGSGSKSTRRKTQSTWGKFSVDLSAYAGQQGYVAIRHFNCTDQFVLNLDDIVISLPGEEEPWNSVETTANKVTITGLTSNTEYEYKIVGKMEATADASSPFGTFTTMENNPMPYDIAVAPGSTSATLSWKGNSDQYEVWYRAAGDETPIFFEDFESSESLPTGWQSVDADGDGYKWYTLPEAKVVLQTDGEMGFYTHSENGIVTSASYINNIGGTDIGALTPDNWLITPQVTLGTKVSAWLRGQDDAYAEEHFAFYVSTTGTDLSDFTKISEEFVATGEYKEYFADLSMYAGQQGYVAIRHYNVTDMYWLNLDDFGIYSMEDGGWQSVSTADTETTLEGLESNTEYEFMIKGIKSGETEASTDVMWFTTNGAPVDIVFSNTYTTDDEVAAAQGVYANVTISDRTLKKDGKWQTICLPFDVDIENSPLAGADVRTVESVTIKNALVILNCPTPVTKLKAGTPYIMRWKEGSDITNPVFEGVTVHNILNNVELYNGEVIFAGLYFCYTFGESEDRYRVMEDGNPLLAPCDYGTIINAFDAYLYVHGNIYSISDAYIMNTGDDDDLITGVSSPKKTEKETIYNLAGMRLSKMQKGINIVNGKKVLVK